MQKKFCLFWATHFISFIILQIHLWLHLWNKKFCNCHRLLVQSLFGFLDCSFYCVLCTNSMKTVLFSSIQLCTLFSTICGVSYKWTIIATLIRFNNCIFIPRIRYTEIYGIFDIKSVSNYDKKSDKLFTTTIINTRPLIFLHPFINK